MSTPPQDIWFPFDQSGSMAPEIGSGGTGVVTSTDAGSGDRIPVLVCGTGGTDMAAIMAAVRMPDMGRAVLITITDGEDPNDVDDDGPVLPELAPLGMPAIRTGRGDADLDEGFWRSRDEPDLPMPIADVDWDRRDAFIASLRSLETRARRTAFKGSAPCRLCDRRSNGSETLTFAGWRWPSGYMHYVRDHGVKPSTRFERFVFDNADDSGATP